MRTINLILVVAVMGTAARADVPSPTSVDDEATPPDPVPPPDPPAPPDERIAPKLVEPLPAIDPPAPLLAAPVVEVSRPRLVHSYRRQMIMTDLVSLALIPVGGVGFLGYLAGGPILHAMNGNGSYAAKSFLSRLLIPSAAIVGTVLALGPSCRDSPSDVCGLGVAIFALGAGAAAAVTVMGFDWYYARKIEQPPAARSWMPMLHVGDRSAHVGIVGRW